MSVPCPVTMLPGGKSGAVAVAVIAVLVVLAIAAQKTKTPAQ